jgi:hypothetical protein
VSGGATAQAVCLPSVSSHRCLHELAWVGCDLIFDCRETEMGPRNSHLETLKENADSKRFSLKDRDHFGGLPVNDEHVPRPMHARSATVRVELEQRISPFGVAL